MNINTSFTRAILAETHRQVREACPEIKHPMKAAWVWNGGRPGRGNWEFHGPDDFFYHVGSVLDAYEARSRGWEAYLTIRERGDA